jgi:hypothetical protein
MTPSARIVVTDDTQQYAYSIPASDLASGLGSPVASAPAAPQTPALAPLVPKTGLPPLQSSYTGAISTVVPTINWSTGEPATMRRYSPLDDCVWVSGIPPVWDNPSSRWVLTGTSPRLIRVVTPGTRVAVGWTCLVANSEKFRFYIDGRPTALTSVSPSIATAAGTTYWATLTLPANPTGADRVVEILMSGAQGLIAIDLEPGAEKVVDHPTWGIGWVTDSFGGGGGVATIDSMVMQAILLLGCDFHMEAEGNAGFSQIGTNGTNFGHAGKISRMALFNPHSLGWVSGVNDDPATTGYAAAVAKVMSDYAAVCTRARQFSVGPMPTAAVSTIGGTWRPSQTVVVKAAIETMKGVYIDTTGLAAVGGEVPAAYSPAGVYALGDYVTHVGAIWVSKGAGVTGRAPGTLSGTGSPWVQVGRIKLNGTGKAGAVAGDGNRDLLLSNDGAHYTPEGHRYAAWEIASAVREAT